MSAIAKSSQCATRAAALDASGSLRAGGGPCLSPETLALLTLVAAHDGVTPEQFMTQAVCGRAEAIGLPGLLDDDAYRAPGHGISAGEAFPARGPGEIR